MGRPWKLLKTGITQPPSAAGAAWKASIALRSAGCWQCPVVATAGLVVVDEVFCVHMHAQVLRGLSYFQVTPLDA